MDHRPGQIELIRWQGRRLRQNRGLSLWTILLVVCGVLGGLGLAGQAMEFLPVTGPAAFIPAALIVLAISVQAVTILRAGLVWLGG